MEDNMERGWRTTRSLLIHSMPPKGQQLVGQTCTCPLSQPLHKDPTFIPSLSGRTIPMSPPHLHPLQEDLIHVSSSPAPSGGPCPCHLPISILSRKTLPMLSCPQSLQEDSAMSPPSPTPLGEPQVSPVPTSSTKHAMQGALH